MSKKLSRRHMLSILGASAALGGGALTLRALQSAPVPVRWNGEVLGALSSMTLWHSRPGHAERTIARMLSEVDRLDRVFSLYRADSDLVRLNQSGRLERASRDLIEVTEAALKIAEVSKGAFDPTIQPLWTYHAAGQQRAEGRDLDAVLAKVGYEGVLTTGSGIGFAKDGMAISLNGIAQGYITDRITDLLANEGFEQAMIELGETRALGQGPKAPFEVGIIDPAAPDRLARSVALAGEALAVSGGYGLRLDGGSHIFNPRTGLSPTSLEQVAVLAPKATTADALSTAIYVAGAEAAPRLLADYPGARAILWKADGEVLEV